MSINIDVDTEGTIVRIHTLKAAIKGIMTDITEHAADMIAECVREEIMSYGLVRTGSLLDSVEVNPIEDGFSVAVTAPHAKFINDGTRPSPGRYVPILDRRLVGLRVARKEKGFIPFNIGWHPGVRPRHFFENGIVTALDAINDTWLETQLWDIEGLI